MKFTDKETLILNRIQYDLPIVEDPFQEVADELHLDSGEVREVIIDLKERGIVRNIAGIFNASSLGYVSSLVALKVPENSIEDAIKIINGHPGVSHNYIRNHEFNIWFTLAEESIEYLQNTIKYFESSTGAEKALLFKNEKLYKIGLMLNVGNNNNNNDGAEKKKKKQHIVPEARTFTDEEKEAILLLQQDLPVTGNPFDSLIDDKESSLSVQELLTLGNDLKAKGYMRRYSAVLRHMKTGYSCNAMTAWKPGKDADIEGIADIFKGEQAISHLYLRTIYPGVWEYPLFAMIHSRSEKELNEIISNLSNESDMKEYQILKTVKELKKEKVIYFSPAFKSWKKKETIRD